MNNNIQKYKCISETSPIMKTHDRSWRSGVAGKYLKVVTHMCKDSEVMDRAVRRTDGYRKRFHCLFLDMN